MESLAFNIMARIDDVLYVDDAIKQPAAAETVSLFSRSGFSGHPIQRQLSPSPFSILHTPYASPFMTPIFCSPTPLIGSPRRATSSLKKNDIKEEPDREFEKPFTSEFEKVWSYTGSLSARRVSENAPERD